MTDSKEAKSLQCPNCGGPLAHSIETGKWACGFCNSDFTLDQVEAPKSEKNQKAYSLPGQTFDAGQTVVLACPSCGAQVVAERNTTSTFCAFCHSPTVLSQRLEGVNRPDLLIPFKYTREQALERLRSLCAAQRTFLPSAFKNAVQKGEITGLYVPYWLFSGSYNASVTAEATKVKRWQEGDKQFTQTERYDIARDLSLPITRLPVDGSQRMDDAVMENIEPYDYSELTPFSMAYLSGHVAEGYDTAPNECQKRCDERVTKVLEAAVRLKSSGYDTVKIKQAHYTVSGRRTEYALLPVWTLAVPFGGEVYTFTMNAQTGKLTGRFPENKAKVRQHFWAVAGVVGVVCAFLLGGWLWA